MSRLLYGRTGEGPPDALFTSADGTVTKGWLTAPDGGRPARPVRYVLTDVVARWFGVEASAVSHWMKRDPGSPQPVAELAPQGRGGRPRVAWPEDSRRAFEAWQEARPGQGAKGTQKPGAGRRSKSGQHSRALIGAGAVSEVLAGFPFRAPVAAGRDTRAAEDAAGGRLIITGTGDDRMLCARDLADAASASEVMPGLVFYQAGGSGGGAG